MCVVVTLETPNTNAAPDSAPCRLVRAHPNATIEVLHFGREGVLGIPYLWVRGDGHPDIQSTIKAEPQIRECVQLDTIDQGSLFKAVWETDSPLLLCVAEHDGIVREAHGTRDQWMLELWFEEQDQASRFQDYCRGRSVPIEIHRLSSVADRLAGNGSNLSDTQIETLELAIERG